MIFPWLNLFEANIYIYLWSIHWLYLGVTIEAPILIMNTFDANIFIVLSNAYMKLDISERERCKDRGQVLWMVGTMHGASLECTLSQSKWELYMLECTTQCLGCVMSMQFLRLHLNLWARMAKTLWGCQLLKILECHGQ